MGKAEQWIIGLAIFGSLISFDTLIFHSLSFISGALLYGILHKMSFE